MKIAVLSFYSGLIDRGVETWAKDLKEHLGELHIEIIGGEKYGKVIDWKRTDYKYWRLLLTKHALSTINIWTEADIIIPTNGTVQTLICRLVTWVFRKPMVVFGHSGPGADDKWNLLCSPNVFVAFSSYQKNWAEKHKLPWTKVVKISHAVDTDKFIPAIKKPRNKSVLCVAANHPSKRVELVRRAAMEAGFSFLAVGKGQEKEVSHDEMPGVYKEADIFCFVPEPWEAFGLVFLEAMSANLPVVTTNDPVRREIVGHAGVLVKDPENINHLAHALEIAYKIKWGKKPRVQAEKFSWQNISKKYETLFGGLYGK